MRIRRPAASGPRLASHTPESDGGRILAVIHSAVADLALQEQNAAQAVSTKAASCSNPIQYGPSLGRTNPSRYCG